MRTLKDLFLDELADRYDSERRLVIAMPKMIKAATCPNLRKVLETHLMETERQVAKVEKVFKLFGKKPSTKKHHKKKPVRKHTTHKKKHKTTKPPKSTNPS